MSEIEIKPIDEFDVQLLKDLVSLDEEAFGKWAYNEWILAPFIRYGRVYALYFEEELAGMAVFFRKWNNPEVAYLASIAVSKKMRGKGLGKQFIEKCLVLVKRDCDKVKLHVDPDNKAAYKIYFDHFGFEPISYIKDEYGKGMDRIVMELDLEDFLKQME